MLMKMRQCVIKIKHKLKLLFFLSLDQTYSRFQSMVKINSKWRNNELTNERQSLDELWILSLSLRWKKNRGKRRREKIGSKKNSTSDGNRFDLLFLSLPVSIDTRKCNHHFLCRNNAFIWIKKSDNQFLFSAIFYYKWKMGLSSLVAASQPTWNNQSVVTLTAFPYELIHDRRKWIANFIPNDIIFFFLHSFYHCISFVKTLLMAKVEHWKSAWNENWLVNNSPI